MTLEEEFYKAVSAWKDHCYTLELKIKGNAESRLDCDAYRYIVSLGKDALPLIYDVLEARDWNTYFPILGWVNAIQDITKGKYKQPKNTHNAISTIGHATNWLAENMDRYIIH